MRRFKRKNSNPFRQEVLQMIIECTLVGIVGAALIIYGWMKLMEVTAQ